MIRTTSWAAVVVAFAAAAGMRPAHADDPKPGAAAPPAEPKLATDEQAAAAIEAFKRDWKATGLKGDDKTSQREFAMAQASRTVHRLVVDELAKVTRGTDEVLRMIAVAYLGDQRALPAYAGVRVSAAMRANPKETILWMTGFQSIGALKYLGAREDIRIGLKHTDYAVKKNAIRAVGRTGDLRMLPEMLEIVGVKVEKNGAAPAPQQDADTKQGGATEETPGYSWAGAEVVVDGVEPTAAEVAKAEAAVNKQIAENKAQAEASARAGGGGTPAAGAGGGDSGGGAASPGRGGGSTRNPNELLPSVLGALKQLTGQTFAGPKEIRAWLKAHNKEFVERCAKLDEAEKAQAAAAK